MAILMRDLTKLEAWVERPNQIKGLAMMMMEIFARGKSQGKKDRDTAPAAADTIDLIMNFYWYYL